MTSYYNEFDPFAAAWLRELIADGLTAPGDVDTRSIKDVQPDDLKGYQQCHFFAGIGGWSYALRLAGWGDDRPVWTGSCPCQPFSASGQQKGEADPRHLWPEFRRLIAECQPTSVFGEQVASPAGRKWLAGIRSDLEALEYRVGAADLCAAGIGAPHVRQRLFWLADANGGQSWDRHIQSSGQHGQQPEDCGAGRLAEPEGEQHDRRRAARNWWGEFAIRCSDGRDRRIEPSIFPVVDGLPNRLATVRGAGNAIAPFVAAEFIKAATEALESDRVTA